MIAIFPVTSSSPTPSMGARMAVSVDFVVLLLLLVVAVVNLDFCLLLV